MRPASRAWAAGTFGLLAAASISLAAQMAPPPPPPPPVPLPLGQARDSQSSPTATNTGTSAISGRVTLAGSGHPVPGVRVTLSGAELRGGRSALTDDDGNYTFTSLPAGTFTIRGALTGYISGTYGQKQVGRPGTAIVLAASQQMKDVSFDIAKGAVISGTVVDEKNRPSISTPVRILRWVVINGERTLQQTGSSTTDDRGMYRSFNLQPGDYIVSAVPRNTSMEVFTAVDMEMRMRVEEAAVNGFRVNLPELPSPQATNEAVQGYAPVYFPGTTQLANARAITLGISQEQLGVDLQLVRVPLSRVTGQVIVPGGVNASSVQIRLFPTDGTPSGVGQMSARATQNGTFTFQQVVPGQYTVFATMTASAQGGVASGERIEMLTRELQMLQNPAAPIPAPPPPSQRRMWAQAEVFVDGSYPPIVTLTLQDGVAVSGSVSFAGSAAVPQGNSRVRVSMNPVGQLLPQVGVGSLSATVDASGRFTLSGAVPGRYRISASGASGWLVKNVMVGGVDVLDFPFEITPGTPVPPVTIQFGDKNTDLKGTLTGSDGAPTADYSVVIFPEDQRYWIPFARRMRSTRPSTDGKFSIMGLPPGDYRMAAVTDLDPADLTNPEFLRELVPASISVRLAEGSPAIQDIRVR